MKNLSTKKTNSHWILTFTVDGKKGRSTWYLPMDGLLTVTIFHDCSCINNYLHDYWITWRLWLKAIRSSSFHPDGQWPQAIGRWKWSLQLKRQKPKQAFGGKKCSRRISKEANAHWAPFSSHSPCEHVDCLTKDHVQSNKRESRCLKTYQSQETSLQPYHRERHPSKRIFPQHSSYPTIPPTI